MHFFNILNLVYDSSVNTPVSFYNQYRSLMMTNTAKTGDTIRWNSNTLTEDEKFVPPPRT